jgi:hypothetical protein
MSNCVDDEIEDDELVISAVDEIEEPDCEELLRQAFRRGPCLPIV